MKTDAISTHERCLIVHELLKWGKWEKQTHGARITLLLYRSEGKECIQYGVTRGSQTISQQVRTLNDAMRCVNEIIRGGKRKRNLVVIPRRVAQGGGDTWLPYKD